MSLTDEVPVQLSGRANAPARIGPTIVERKPFGPAVPEKTPAAEGRSPGNAAGRSPMR